VLDPSALIACEQASAWNPGVVWKINLLWRRSASGPHADSQTILRQADFSPSVYEDTQIDTLVAEIEDEVRSQEGRRV